MIELNRDNYENEAVESKKPVVVDFWGPQCKPCLMLMPAVERFEKDYNEKIKFGAVCAVENRMLCARLRVISLPTFVFYKDGNEVNRLTGESISEADIKRAIDELIQ